MATNATLSNRLPMAASLLLALALWVYMALRAVKVGFTHDESSSFMNLIQEPLRDVFFSARNWQAANNHLLNTLCMQAGYHFFGAQEWALRWGSLVAGLIFPIYALRMVRLWLPTSSWYFFGAFCILVLQHFVLDFFSLARGYGWCVAFEMAGLYYFFRWIQQERRSDLFKTACALSAGILANFTLLDVLAAVFITVTLAFYVKNDYQFPLRRWLQLLALPALPVLVTGLVIFQPMRWISAQGEFEYGPQAFWETWRILVERFTYTPVFGKWWQVLELIVATMLFLGLGYAIFKRYKTVGMTSHPPLFYASILTVSTMLATMAQHYLLGANYLSGRTALLFYPLLSVVVVLYLIDSRQRIARPPWRWGVATGFVTINFCLQINLLYSIEWRYDQNTQAALLFAHEHSAPQHKLNYGVGWLYYSTTLFYQQTRSLYNVQVVEYNTSHDDVAWVMAQPFDLIFLEPKLEPQLANSYAVLQHYPQGIMMQRK